MARLLVVYPKTINAMLPAMDWLSQGQTQQVKLAMTAIPVAQGCGWGGSMTRVQDKVVVEKKEGSGETWDSGKPWVWIEGQCGLPGPAGRGLRAS